jgi:hypothetical protein
MNDKDNRNQLLEVHTEPGKMRLIPWGTIQSIDLNISEPKKVSGGSPDSYASVKDCTVTLVGESTFNLSPEYTNRFLGGLQAMGFYTPQSIQIQSESHAHAGSTR